MTVNYLKRMREASLLSPEDFAREIGSSPAAYIKVERGEAPVREIHLNAARWALVLIAGVDVQVARNLSHEMKEVIRAAAANL